MASSTRSPASVSSRSGSAGSSQLAPWVRWVLLGAWVLLSSPNTLAAEAPAHGLAQPHELLQSLPHHLVKRSNRMRLCGDQLVNTLRLVCASVRGKRSVDAYETPDDDNDDVFEPPPEAIQDEQEEDEEDKQARFNPMYHRFRAMATMKVVPSRQRRSGIVQQCCVSACTLAELITYC